MGVDRNRFFREVTLRVSGSLDISEALRSTLGYLAEFMPVDAIGLYRFDTERMAVFPVAEETGGGEGRPLLEPLRSFPIDRDLQQRIEDSRERDTQVTIHNTPEQLPASVRECFPHLESNSVIALHLRIKQEDVGGLVLSAGGHNRYTEEHAALLEEVREPIALAMSHAWQFGEMKRLRDQLAEDNRALSLDMERVSGNEVVGADFGLASVMESVRRVAPLSSPVLLQGETGTGKEVIANTIHLLSNRSQGPMIRVQCGAIPDALLDSELFGHEKGSFTGAVGRKRGRFERAAGGTIFLDEVAELTPEAQVKLLRVLQEKEFERVGGTETLTADVRVIAATHRDLPSRIREGKFREDLWFRLNVFPIHIPPLRMRREDIGPLAHYFVERKARELNVEFPPEISASVLTRLRSYAWPGNVRELQNVIERALILSRGGTLHVPEWGGVAGSPGPAAPEEPPVSIRSLDEAMANYIRHALDASGGRISGPGGAAERLCVHPSTLRSRMKRLGLRITRSAHAGIRA